MEDVIKKVHELQVKNSMRWSQVDQKQLYLSQMLDGNFQLIKSYATVVGLVDHANDTMYEIGKYSKTTSCQITHLQRNVLSGYKREYVEGRV